MDSVLLGDRSELIRTWLTHPSHDLYWQKFLPTAEQFAQIDIPVLTIAGYYGAEAGALYFHHEHRRNRPQADTTLLLGPYDAASIRLGTAAQLRGYTLDAVARVDLPSWLPMARPRLQGREEACAAAGSRQLPGDGRQSVAPCADAAIRPSARRCACTLTPASATARTACRLRRPKAVAARDSRSISPIAATETSHGRTRCAASNCRHATASASSSDPLPQDTEIDGSLRGEFDITPSRQDVDLSVSLYEQTASGEYLLLFEPYDFRASYAGHRAYRRLLRAGERQLLAFTAERVTARKLAAGSRLVLLSASTSAPTGRSTWAAART